MTDKATRALVYCRVSDSKQKTHGDGLNSQQTRCREYAKYKGYEVVQVFVDDASGSLINRPGMKAMLTYLRQDRRCPHAVIIDDISRLARGLETHLQLRAAIASAGGVLESPSAYFSDRGRPEQADRGRRNEVAAAALGRRAGTELTVAQSSTISLKWLIVMSMSGLDSLDWSSVL